MKTDITLKEHAPQGETSRGALLFYSQFDDPTEWADALQAAYPGLDIRIYPDVGNADDITYVLAWRPPEGFFAPYKNIKLVVNLGAGVDSLTGRADLPEVPICRLSDSGMMALMRSYVLFAVIRYARDMPDFEKAQRQSEWRYIHPTPLDRIRVGVLGLGALGSAAARSLADLTFDVRGWDLAPKQIDGVACFSDPGEWENFLGDVDILVNMMPLTTGTRGMLDKSVFDALKPGTKFVNASRGEVVNEDDLLAALRSGQVGAATLDVFVSEPLRSDHPFWKMENVYITPHLASITVPDAAARDVAANIRRVEQGEAPLHQVNPKAGF
ncbi:2-hydroxyacid dehydrogenase [Pseudohoeflea coraliihabitans]|uniref:Glyoxylate/hydroxypyruvate reductase A n=1 Tax=Pseudohoeflea coraliihabitans TaxID=2860393 RepID=A0ABS6WIS5_9HYPH|nr:glyoxylate/hydroxypyruvate reductase A [Pseudohoeflea sp. DP4N28-3]MBW3095842.1 glyoxylate/hydroxypyruvate reductase A [Pseudohoeflea sp. DP4N28-3]